MEPDSIASGFVNLFSLNVKKADELVKAGKSVPPKIAAEILKELTELRKDLKLEKDKASVRFRQSIGIGSVIGIAGILIGLIV